MLSKIYKELGRLNINKVNNLKMGYRSKERIFNRRISNGQESLKMFKGGLPANIVTEDTSLLLTVLIYHNQKGRA